MPVIIITAAMLLPAQTIPLTYIQVDASMAGDCKMVGDIDGDELPDLIIGGMPGEKLNWYKAPNWTKTVIATPASEFTTDGALGDIDGDGDLDIIIPDGNGTNNLLWFRNPRPGGNATNGSLWARRVIGSVGGWGKDVKPADFDGNGRLDIASRSDGQAMIFFQTADDAWLQVVLPVSSLGSEGLGQGDLDQDGDEDLIVCGAWLANPGGTAARTPASWTEHSIGSADSSFKALMADLNQDGYRDVVFSSSEGMADVIWWKPVTGDPTGSWSGRTVLPAMSGVHTLQAADMDLDGDTDIVVAQMHTTSAKKILLLFNADGLGTSWQTQEVAATGLHNGVVADIENDGDFDIYGANWTGNPPLKLWLNNLSSGETSLSVVAPAFGAIWEKGSAYVISWQKEGAQSAHVKIHLFKGTSTLVKILTTKTENDGSFNWLVPRALAVGTYFIRVQTIDNLLRDDSDKFQVIVPTISITAPAPGAIWLKNDIKPITWSTLGTQNANVKIQLYKSTAKKLDITLSTPNNGSYDWPIPSSLANGTNYSVHITTLDGKVKGVSNKFTIGIGLIKVIQPAAAVNWQRGLPYIISWTHAGDLINANVKIQLFRGTTLASTLTVFTPNDGSFEWTIPANQAVAANYKVRVTTVDNLVKAESGKFTISINTGLALAARH